MIKLNVIFSRELEEKMHRRDGITRVLRRPGLPPLVEQALTMELGALSAELAVESEMAVRVAFSVHHARQHAKQPFAPSCACNQSQAAAI